MIFILKDTSKHFTQIMLFWFTGMVVFIIITGLDRSIASFSFFLLIPMLTYLGTAFYLEKNKITMEHGHWIQFWIATIVIRIFVLFFPIGLSDDIYRYIWDGKVQHAGYNPYLYSPDATQLVELQEGWWFMINNPHVPTPYPPFSQLVFWGIASFNLSISTSILFIRIIMLSLDLGIILLLVKLIRFFKLPDRRIVIYAWSPLPILEYAGNGHNDVIAVFFMILAIYLTITSNFDQRKTLLSAISLAIAFLTKTFPIFAFPFLLKHWRITEILVFITIISITSIFYINNKVLFPIIPTGQIIFLKQFRFNESIFRVIEKILSNFTTNSLEFTRTLAITIVLIITFREYWRYWKLPVNKKSTHGEMMNSIIIILFSLLLFGSDVQPWYLLWILPFVVIKPHISVIVWSLTSLFSYAIFPLYDSQGIWREKTSILLIEYVPVYFLVCYQIAIIKFNHKQNKPGKIPEVE